jgi:hypothetical protein
MALLESTWHTRDLPVLIAAARKLESGHAKFRASELAPEVGIGEGDATRAAIALAEGRYLQVNPIGSMQGLSGAIVIALTERGRRTVGLWPSEDLGDDLVATLRQAAEAVPDEDERGMLKKAANALGGVSRDILTEVAAAVIARQAGA